MHSRLETQTREDPSDDQSWLACGQQAFATYFLLPWQVIERWACSIGHRSRLIAHVVAPCSRDHTNETCCYDCARTIQFGAFQYDNFNCAVRLELILRVALDFSHRQEINLQARRVGLGGPSMTLACRKTT